MTEANFGRKADYLLPSIGDALQGKRVLVTGSSRGIGADTARYFAANGASVAINYRDPRKEKRAAAVLRELVAMESDSMMARADLTDIVAVEAMFRAIVEKYDGLDILVLNASGGMEVGVPDDYALRLNRDAQTRMVDMAEPTLADGGRVVFVTSHQAHFSDTVDTLPEYRSVARSKKAGEMALRQYIPRLASRGIGFTVVSGDMIDGTITAKLLDRANPGTIEHRRESVGLLPTVKEFAEQITLASVEPIPDDHITFVGDIREFTQ